LISAYTLIRIKPTKTKDVFREIQKIPLVRKTVPVYGEYDLIVETETKNLDMLHSFVYTNLRTNPNILTTTTMITARIA